MRSFHLGLVNATSVLRGLCDVTLLGYPGRRERRPSGCVATTLRQPKAVRAVGEDVNGVRDLVGGERRGQAIGVLRGT